MMKKLVKPAALLLCALLALAPALAEEPAIPDGRWLCADIQGNVTADTPAELRDDFGLFVNKDWILSAEIPAGETSTGTLDEVDRTLKDRKIALMKDETLTGYDAELVHKLYRLATDWDYRNARGTEPAMPTVSAIQAIGSLEDVTAYLYNRENPFRFLPLGAAVGTDLADPTRYISQIAAPRLMLQDSAEYAARTPAGELYYAISQQIGSFMLQRLGFSEEESARIIENAFAFEAKMAAHIRPAADQYAPDYLSSLMNYYTPEELEQLAGDFPIMEMMARGSGMKPGSLYLVTEPDYVASLAGIYTEENVGLIRDWLMLRAATSMVDALDRETYEQAEAIQNAILGVSGRSSDDDVALQLVSGLLIVPMDNLYIRAYCSEKEKEDIEGIISEVLDEYRDILAANDWLSPETRDKAIEKLDSILVNAVYPDQLGDWSALDFKGPEEGGSLLEARAAITEFVTSIIADRVDTVVDRTAWDQLLQPAATANASYNPQYNSINILAGILSGDIYNENMSYEEMLGAIGSVIGHEISHAFDTNGAQFDKNGALASWWTAEDYAVFQERAAKLVAWYDGFIPDSEITYSGQMVQTEAIADMGGMKCVLGIAARQEGFDYDAFFRQFASVWRCQMVRAFAITKTARDTHPMNYLRVNCTLAQFDDFVSFYGLQPGDGMYIAPEDRVAVW